MKINLLLIFLVITSNSFSQPFWQWAQGYGRYTSHDYCNGIATDNNGNTYITGEFQDTLNFGNTVLINPGSYNSIMYVAKFDQQGNFLWARIPQGNNGSAGNDISIDTQGNYYVTGFYRGNLVLDSTSLNASAVIQSMFVAKFDSAGNTIWARDAISYFRDAGTSVHADADGSVYVTGIHEDSAITFGNITVPSVGGNDIYLVKYDLNGNVLWATGGGGSQEDLGKCVTTDKAGNVYLAGSFRNSITMGSITLSGTNNGGGSALIVKYDPLGSVLWARNSGGFPSSGFATGVSTDAYDNCYVTGHFNSPEIYFDNDTLVNAGVEDIFVLKYDSTGNLVWSRRAGGNNFDRGLTICTDDIGNSYVSGFIKSGSANFGSVNLFSVNQEIFVVKYDPSGNVEWGLQSNGSLNDVCNSISLSGNDIYIGGEFSSPTTLFNPHTITNSDAFLGSYDLYISKISNINTSLSEIESDNHSLIVYPNPCSEFCKIRISNYTPGASLEIYNSLGQIIHKQKCYESEVSIDSKLINGVYYIRLTTDGGNVKKLIVNN